MILQTPEEVIPTPIITPADGKGFEKCTPEIQGERGITRGNFDIEFLVVVTIGGAVFIIGCWWSMLKCSRDH